MRRSLPYKLLVTARLGVKGVLHATGRSIGRFGSVIKSHYGDKRLGIDTSEADFDDAEAWEPTGYRLLERLMRYLEPTPEDTFVDIGCGKGRVVLFAATYKLKKVVGVELRENLAEAARTNLQKLTMRNTPVEIVNCNAVDFDPKEGTIFFMFNPFGFKTLQAVLGNIRDSLRTNPRDVRIVYYNPILQDVVDAEDWLTRAGEPLPGVCVWQSRTRGH